MQDLVDIMVGLVMLPITIFLELFGLNDKKKK